MEGGIELKGRSLACRFFDGLPTNDRSVNELQFVDARTMKT